MKEYEGWEEELLQLFKVCPCQQQQLYLHLTVASFDNFFPQCADKVKQWVVLAVDELPVFTHGNVALLGDAVSIHKHSGLGANISVPLTRHMR